MQWRWRSSGDGGERRLILTTSAAIFGISAGIALLPLWLCPAKPGQLPGYMTSAGLDAGASFHFLTGLVICTFFCALAIRPFAERLANARTWVIASIAASLSSALWIALAQEGVLIVTVVPLAFAALCYLLRGIPQRFTRSDVILIPAFFSVFLALHDLTTGATHPQRVIFSALLVATTRVLLPLVRRGRPLRFGHYFAAAPIALLLQTHYLGYSKRHAGWPSLVITLATPFALRLISATGTRRRRMRMAIAWIVHPATILCLANATSLLTAEGLVRADLFEDSHNLTIASEMLRGERPYRDIMPAHGLIQDGLLDFLILETRDVTAGHAVSTRGVIGSMVWVADYAIAAGVTGSADAGLLAYFLGVALGTPGGGFRMTPAFFAIAALACAVRRREPGWFRWAAILVIFAGLTSLDFGFYSAVAMIAAIVRLPSSIRRTAVRSAIRGGIIAGGTLLLGLTIAGITGPFIRTTLFEVATLGPVYAMMPYAAPPLLKQHAFPPDFLLGIFDNASLSVLLWCACVLGVAISISTGRRASHLGPHKGALTVVAVMIIACGLSYAERQHAYAAQLTAPLLVALMTLVIAAAHAATPGYVRDPRGRRHDRRTANDPPHHRRHGAEHQGSDESRRRRDSRASARARCSLHIRRCRDHPLRAQVCLHAHPQRDVLRLHESRSALFPPRSRLSDPAGRSTVL